MFSQACVILFTGGVSVSVHAGIPPPPPRADTPPPEQTPPVSRHPRNRHPPGADTPGADTPPPGADTPPAEHAGRYGQRAGGTHPTGIQSCLFIVQFLQVHESVFHHSLFAIYLFCCKHTLYFLYIAKSRNTEGKLLNCAQLWFTWWYVYYYWYLFVLPQGLNW